MIGIQIPLFKQGDGIHGEIAISHRVPVKPVGQIQTCALSVPRIAQVPLFVQINVQTVGETDSQRIPK